MFELLDVDGLGLAEDCELGPDVIIGALAGAEPGSQLHGWLSMLDVTRLSEGQLMAVGAAWERQRRHDAAIELALLHRLGTLPVAVPDSVDHDGDRCSELTGPLRWADRIRSKRTDLYAALTAQSTTTVFRKAAAALALAPDGPLAATGAALAAGQVSDIRAKAIADKLGHLDRADAAAIEAAVLPDADLLSRGRLERDLDTRVAALNPKTEQEQHVEARARRGVSRPQPLPAGMAFLEALGPAEDIHLLHTALTSIAGVTQDAARAAARQAARAARADGQAADTESQAEGIDAHRFDALINLAAGALADGSLPTRHGKRPAIGITMALSTLLGLDDHPADLAGHGPITAEAARRAAADPTGTLQRIITAPNGLVIDAAYTSYRPPQALCDTIIARDRTCTFPRCTQPAIRCDIDHQNPWPDGTTCLDNNHALCRGHHNLKTAGAVSPQYDPDTGDTTWTLPWGQTIRRPAHLNPQPPPPPDQPAPNNPGPGTSPRTRYASPDTSTEPIPPGQERWPRALRAIADALGPRTHAPPAAKPALERTDTVDDDPPPY